MKRSIREQLKLAEQLLAWLQRNAPGMLPIDRRKIREYFSEHERAELIRKMGGKPTTIHLKEGD